MKRLFTGLIILLTSVGFAHQPFWNPGSPSLEQAYRILEPTVSKVVTSQVNAGQLGFYVPELASGFVLDLGLFVGAACPPAFQPRMWLVGPGLEGHELRERLRGETYYLAVEAGNAAGYYMLSLAGAEVPGGMSKGRAALARFNRCG